jgi:hypothetical protein
LDIRIRKIFNINNKFLAVKQPLNCSSSDIFILLRQQEGQVHELISVLNLHEFIQKTNQIHLAILPIGNLCLTKLQQILKKFPSINYFNRQEIIKMKQIYPCYIHKVFRNSNKVYGVRTSTKRGNTFGSTFNFYKKVSRNWKR